MLTETRRRGLAIASPVCCVHTRLLLGTTLPWSNAARFVSFTLLREGETLRMREAKRLLRLTRSTGRKQRRIKRGRHACRLANVLLSFFVVQKKPSSFVCLPAKTSTQICRKPLKGNGGVSPRSLLGANMERKTQTDSFPPPPSPLCVCL